VNLDSQDTLFHGTFILFVKDTEHLGRIIDRIKKIRGVDRAERFVE
jgi:hypothetical protein